MAAADFEERVAGVASLAEPQRRALYRYVVTRDGPVGKDEAAAAMGVARSVAAFHLDRLVADGLLTTEYRRLSGRRGPGAGRPAKLYRRAEGEHTVSVPPRAYGEAGRLLAEVVEQAGLDRELQARAREAGARERTGGDARNTDVTSALRDRGYEPRWDGDTLRLANCPFHALAEEFPALVCGMNLALLEGLAPEGWTAAMDPRPGGCCVSLRCAEGRPEV
jgi:predicted ArsR family transcriptional regulator